MQSVIASLRLPGAPRFLFLTLCFHFTFCLYLAALPQELVQRGANSAAIGVVVGAFGLGAIGIRFALVRVFSRASLVELFRLSAGLLFLAMLGYTFMPLSPWLSLARVLHGAALALFATSAALWVSSAAQSNQIGTMRGIEGAAAGLAVVVAPSLGLVLTRAWGFGALNWMCLGIALLVAFAPLRCDARSSDNTVRADRVQIWVVLVCLLLAGALLGALQAFIPAISTWKANFPLTEVMLVFGVALVAGRLFGGMFSDSIGRSVVIRLSAAVVVLAIAAFYMASSKLPLMFSTAAFALGIGGFTTAISAWLVDITQAKSDQGSVIGLSGASWEVGIAFGPMILGLAGLFGGIQAVFICIGMVALLQLMWVIVVSIDPVGQRGSDHC